MPSKEGYYNSKGDSESNSHWLPWLQHELLIKDILTQTPEMPSPFEPDYNLWKSVLDQFILNEDTILIGHSCGAGFILRYLSENNIKVGKIFLIAPWIDPTHKEAPKMFEFEIDSNLQSKTGEITVFLSNDDDNQIIDSVNIIKSKLNMTKILEFSSKGHFCLKDMNTREFPELLEEILKRNEKKF